VFRFAFFSRALLGAGWHSGVFVYLAGKHLVSRYRIERVE
jgi:hypothetical protein